MDLKNLLREKTKIYFAQTLFKFEDIDLSPIQTKALLEGSLNKKLALDYEDSIVVRNVIDALKFLKEKDLNKLQLTTNLYIKLNEILAKEQALDVGYFRDSNVTIGCIDEPILPPQIEEIENCLTAINNVTPDNFKSVIAENFSNLIKLQPFFDGNKRSTLFYCNVVLLKKELGMFYIETEKYDIFENELTKYYTNTQDCKFIKFLKEECIKGVDELGISIIQKSY